MLDPKEMTDEELDAQVTNDVILEASGKPADPTAKETDKLPAKDPNPKGDVEHKKDPDPKGGDGEPAKKEVPESIKTLLSKKNEEKKLKEEAQKTVADQKKIIEDQQKIIDNLKNPNDDDKLSDEERAEKLQEAITKKTIAEGKKDEAIENSKAIDTVDETQRATEIGEFLNKNPELLANKEEIMDLATSYPTLPMEQVHKLRIANTDPTKLLSEQEVNKIKGGFNLAGKFDRSKVDGKDPSKMTDEELESSLNSAIAGGENILGG